MNCFTDNLNRCESIDKSFDSCGVFVHLFENEMRLTKCNGEIVDVTENVKTVRKQGCRDAMRSNNIVFWSPTQSNVEYFLSLPITCLLFVVRS